MIVYRGAGIGSYWHVHNPAVRGFTARAPHTSATSERLMHHISRGTGNSPFISLTRSYAVARHYAVLSSARTATPTDPAYVYEIEIQFPLPAGLQLLDPVKEVALALPELASVGPPYQHDGMPNFLLGVADPENMKRFLEQHAPQPPSNGGTPRPPNLSMELETLVRVLRDAEILALGIIPATCVRNCFRIS